jgi:hypothetical protein
MSVERNLLIAILKLTRTGVVTHEIINKDARISSDVAEELLQKMQSDGLVYVKANTVEVDGTQRLKLAIRAIGLGADLEQVSSFLQWQEFEGMAATALIRNGYAVSRNLHFTHGGRKWEMDVVGSRKPIALCLDCKHWHYGMHPARLKTAVDEQVQRTAALAETLPRLDGKVECASWERAKLVPAVLSLVVGRFKFIDDVPIVPILQLQDFLDQILAYADSLKHFLALRHDFQDRLP